MPDSVIALLLLVGGWVAAEAAAVPLDASTPQPQSTPELPWEPEPEASGCVYRNRTYAVGQRWVTGPPDKCAKFLCEDNDQIAALTCPWFLHPPGCTIVPGDKSAAYPHCCPKRSCPSPSPMASPMARATATASSPEASSIVPVTDTEATSAIPEGAVTVTTIAATTIASTSTDSELGVTDLATASPTASATTPLDTEEEVVLVAE